MVKFETLTIVYFVENRVRLTRPMSWERTTYTRRTKGMTRVTTQEIRRYNVADTTTSSNSGSCGGQRLVRQPSDWFLLFLYFYCVRICRFCVVIRNFHTRHNGQWPPPSKDFHPRLYTLLILSCLTRVWIRKSEYIISPLPVNVAGIERSFHTCITVTKRRSVYVP